MRGIEQDAHAAARTIRNTREEMDRLVQQCEELSEEELMRDVFVEFQFDLCRACQAAYVANPMPLAHTLQSQEPGAGPEVCPGDQE